MISLKQIHTLFYSKFDKIKCGPSIFVHVSSRFRVSATRPAKAKSRLKVDRSEKAEVVAALIGF
jgi:hypothetical protein